MTNFYYLTSPGTPAIGTDGLEFAQLYAPAGTAVDPYFAITQAETTAGLSIQPGIVGQVAYTKFEPGDVRRYGAVGDGVTDDAAAFTSAAAQSKESGGATVTGGTATYLFGSQVNMRLAEVDLRYSTIDIAYDDVGMLIGGNRSPLNNVNPEQRYGTVLRSVGTDSSAKPTIRIMGAYGQHIHIHRSGWIQLYADTDTQPDGIAAGACAYSTFWFNRGITLEWNTNPSPAGSTTQWINENTFYLNRFSHFISDGTYSHNNNRLHGGNFEAETDIIPATIDFVKGTSNLWRDLRFEFNSGAGQTGCEFTFSNATHYNRIEGAWTSSSADWLGEYIYGNSNFDKVTDGGVGNSVVRADDNYKRTFIIGALSADDVVLDTADGDYSERKPSLGTVQVKTANQTILLTRSFRVYKNDIIGFYTETQNAVEPGYRCTIYFRDADGKEVAPQKVVGNADITGGDNFIGANMTGIGSGHVFRTSDGPSGVLGLAGDAVVWAQVKIISGSVRTNCTAKEVTVFVKRTTGNEISKAGVSDIGMYRESPEPVTGVPTEGFAPLGYEAVRVSDGTRYRVVTSVDSALAVAATSGSGSITITAGDGALVTSGDIVGILNDDDYITDWTTVNGAPAGDVITLTANPTGNCAIGNRVVFMLWA